MRTPHKGGPSKGGKKNDGKVRVPKHPNARKAKSLATPVPDTYPMRINKYLAKKGLATRTGVDELIKSGKIFINGKPAVLGDKVELTDQVVVRGTHTKKKNIYLAYNKAKGVVSTNPQGDEKDIMQSVREGLPNDVKIFPIGRLDKESHGLIILTSDGRITDRLLNPIYDHEKEYIVEVDRNFTPGFLRNMEEGVPLSDGITKKATLKKIDDNIFSIILTEGRNRQIRRMTEKLGYTVRDLQRVRVQNIELNKLPVGTWREITGDERDAFLKSMNLE